MADDGQRAEAVLQAAAEIDAAGLIEVADGDGDVAEAKAQAHRLHQELRIKNEIVGVVLKVDTFEYGRLTPGEPSSSFAFAVTLVLALFAMAFGTRRLDQTEHQNGLILAIAPCTA